jgi:type VI secretion system protein VasG
VRSGYILLGMLKTKSLRNALFAISRQFEKIKPDDLADTCRASSRARPKTARRPATAAAPAPPAKPAAPSRRRRWASRRR